MEASKAHSNKKLDTSFSNLKSLKYWHKLPQEVAVSFFFFFNLYSLKQGWVICFNQVQVIRLNMGISGKKYDGIWYAESQSR